MIRINLLPQRKVARSDKGQQSVAGGFLFLGATAAAIYFLVHAPLVDSIAEAQAFNAKLQQSIAQLNEETKDFDTINQQFLAAEEQAGSIRRLNDARSTPAWLLDELSTILTRGGSPTMTREMAERVKTDANRQWNATWDPKRAWITSFVEKGGTFTLKGGAQTDADITQLALRLQASAYFTQVVPETGTQEGKDSLTHYQFTITGKVAY